MDIPCQFPNSGGNNWNYPTFQSSGLKKFAEKLKRLKQRLIWWNKNVVGNIFAALISKEAEVKQAESDLLQNHNTTNLETFQNLSTEFDILLDMEEQFWKQKARCRWILEGDRNTKLFHSMVQRKKSRLRINSISDQGTLLTDPADIQESLIKYFKDTLSGDSPIPGFAEALPIIPTLVTPDMNAQLESLPSLEEIKAVVFDLNKDAAAGPDGYTSHFYHVCWDIIKQDLQEAIHSFFQGEPLPLSYTCTNIALIPKVESPSTWSEYRPISLCNNSIKIITKVMNDKLAPFLPDLISGNQSGFVKGKAIADNILLTQELVHFLDVKKGPSNLVLKLDMMKAYEKIEWSFLDYILSKFGFSTTWRMLVMNTLANCHYSYLLNGEACGFLKASRGLRQGDPLSPALFILTSEYLSRGLNSVFNSHPHMYYDTKGGKRITHLAYADDCIIFCKASKSSLQHLKGFLTHYESLSGQRINLNKSQAFPGKRAVVSVINAAIGIPTATLPLTYLGAPIFRGRKTVSVFNPLIDKIRRKLTGWNLQLISQSGRLILIKNVLSAMPVYLLQVLHPPVTVWKRIEAIFASFFWGSKDTKKSIHWAQWKKLCYPVDEGGLGLRRVSEFSQAFDLKLWFTFRK